MKAITVTDQEDNQYIKVGRTGDDNVTTIHFEFLDNYKDCVNTIHFLNRNDLQPITVHANEWTITKEYTQHESIITIIVETKIPQENGRMQVKLSPIFHFEISEGI